MRVALAFAFAFCVLYNDTGTTFGTESTSGRTGVIVTSRIERLLPRAAVFLSMLERQLREQMRIYAFILRVETAAMEANAPSSIAFLLKRKKIELISCTIALVGSVTAVTGTT